MYSNHTSPVRLWALVALALLASVLASPDRVNAQEFHDEAPAPLLGPADNLTMIQSSSTRNRNHDASPYRDTPMDALVIANHLGPRADYLESPGGNPEMAFPIEAGGQFRIACEFSHFAYDDPLVHPGQPGAAHLHMFFGNTDTNAFSTYESLLNSGSSTCNGQELNRTGYWAPAMFDGNGNVRIPERIVVYYKGEGLANGAAQVYPPGAAMIPQVDINSVGYDVGGALGKPSFKCSDNWSGSEDPVGMTIPVCNGSRFFDEYGVLDNPRVVLEMNVKFPQCWNGADPSDPANFSIPDAGGWYYSLCPAGWTTLPNLEYFINYPVEVGESTAGWYLSSDIDPMTGDLVGTPGSTLHADWWGAWHPDVNRMWIDECVNYSVPGVASGCGFGYLSDGGPDNENPYPGPALQYRPQYEGPISVPATTLHAELCPVALAGSAISLMAYCAPLGHHDHGDHEDHGDHGDGTAVETIEDDPGDFCAGEPATLIGTAGDDVLVGTDGRDVIVGGAGNDTIDGLGGDDLICGNGGSDVIDGGDGNDVVHAGSGWDNVFGGDGDDQVFGGRDDDWLFGEAGNDDLRGNRGDDELHGNDGDDVLRGGNGDDRLIAGWGDDRLRGNGGFDTCLRPEGESNARNRGCEVAEAGW